MKLKKIFWQNFEVLRWSTKSVKILEGTIMFDNDLYTVAEFDPEEQDPPQELSVGTHAAWLKMTFKIRKNLVNLQLVGVDPGASGVVYAKMYNHEYYDPEFEYVVGKSSDQASEDDPIIQRKFGSFDEVFYMKIANIIVSNNALIIENQRVSGIRLTGLFFPTFKEFFGEGSGD